MKQKGITLIALIVTVIVLLILAGVSLRLIAGGDGIMNRASNAVDITMEAKARETVELAWTAAKIEYWDDFSAGKDVDIDDYLTKDYLNEKYINSQGEIKGLTSEIVNGKKQYTVEYYQAEDKKTYIFIIDGDGNIRTKSISGMANNDEEDESLNDFINSSSFVETANAGVTNAKDFKASNTKKFVYMRNDWNKDSSGTKKIEKKDPYEIHFVYAENPETPASISIGNITTSTEVNDDESGEVTADPILNYYKNNSSYKNALESGYKTGFYNGTKKYEQGKNGQVYTNDVEITLSRDFNNSTTNAFYVYDNTDTVLQRSNFETVNNATHYYIEGISKYSNATTFEKVILEDYKNDNTKSKISYVLKNISNGEYYRIYFGFVIKGQKYWSYKTIRINKNSPYVIDDSTSEKVYQDYIKWDISENNDGSVYAHFMTLKEKNQSSGKYISNPPILAICSKDYIQVEDGNLNELFTVTPTFNFNQLDDGYMPRESLSGYLNSVAGATAPNSNPAQVKVITFERFDTSNAIDMSRMFYGCDNLLNLDLSSFDTSNVTNMQGMFWKCARLKSIDISNFNMDNVTNVNSMFSDCYGLTNLDMPNNFANLEKMEDTFLRCYSLSNFNEIKWNVPKLESCDTLFGHCYSLNNIKLNFQNAKQLKNIKYAFRSCKGLDKVQVSFDISGITNMDGMFYCCSNLTNLQFDKCALNEYNADIDNFITGCESLDYYKLPSIKVTSNGVWEGLIYPNWSSASYAKNGKNENLIKEYDFSNLDTSELTSIGKRYNSAVFNNCSRLEKLDFSMLDFSKVKSANSFIKNCEVITEIKLPTNMSGCDEFLDFIVGCRNLKTIDLSSFDMGNATSTTSMFYNSTIKEIITPKVLPTVTFTLPGTFKDEVGNTYTDLKNCPAKTKITLIEE